MQAEWGKEKRERKRKESEEPQGVKGKILIVENFFGLKGQEREKRTKRAKKKL